MNKIRPKYALVELLRYEPLGSQSARFGNTEKYGDVIAVLKDETKKLATWTYGDSYDHRAEPHVFSEETIDVRWNRRVARLSGGW